MTTVLEEIQEPKQPQEQDYKIDQIIPKWSHLLDMMNANEPDKEAIYKYEWDNHLDIGTHKLCIAGEAHIFSDWYMTNCPEFCSVCDNYSTGHLMDLYDGVKDGEFRGHNWRSSSIIINFVKHWNRKHKEVTKQRYAKQ